MNLCPGASVRPTDRRFALLLAAATLVTGLAAGPLAAQEAEYQPPDDPAHWARLAAERLPMLEVCRPEHAQEDMLCGKLPVWEDRAAQAGRKIELNVVVVPAHTETPEPDPVVPIAGGPGEGVAGSAGHIPQGFPDVLAHRDVLLVDQRGTGDSNGLFCSFGVSPDNPQPGYDAAFPLEGVKACRDELSQRADLTQYLTSIAADDLEEVRTWLGYPKLNLVGGSYGTRFSQEFARRHPGSVRTLGLQGLVSMDQRMPLDHARDGQRSMDLVLLRCEEDEACNGAFPHLREEYWDVLDRLDRKPATATVVNPLNQKEVTLTAVRGVYAESLRSMMYTPANAAELPFVVHHAAQGDFGPFFKATIPWRVFIELEIANGLYLSITCSEDTAFFDAEEARIHDIGTALGDWRTAAQLRACSVWPKTEVPASFRQPVDTDVPILIVDGELDPVTPPRFAREAIRHMPNARLVIVRRGHHGFDGLTHQECIDHLLLEFIDKGSAKDLDTSCVDTMESPPFVTQEADMGYAKHHDEEGEGE